MVCKNEGTWPASSDATRLSQFPLFLLFSHFLETIVLKSISLGKKEMVNAKGTVANLLKK